jgi:hypothetical protein
MKETLNLELAVCGRGGQHVDETKIGWMLALSGGNR